MFNSGITVIEPFTGTDMFEETTSDWVDGDEIGCDQTIVATMRALMHPGRTVNKFKVKFGQNVTTQILDADNAGTILNKFRVSVSANMLYVVSIDACALSTFIPALEEKGTAPLNAANGWKRIEAAEKFIANKCGKNIAIFIKPDINFAMILVERISYPQVHLITSFLPLYFPNVFKKHPITDLEKQALASLTQVKPDEYLRLMYQIGKDLGIEQIAIKKILETFTKAEKQRQLDEAEHTVDHCRSMVDDAMELHVSRIHELEEAIYRCEGIRVALTNMESDKELYEYFASHPNLKVINAFDGAIEFIVSGFLDTCDSRHIIQQITYILLVFPFGIRNILPYILHIEMQQHPSRILEHLPHILHKRPLHVGIGAFHHFPQVVIINT